MKTSLTIKSLLPAVLLGLLPMSAPAQDQLEPGDTFRDCPECPEMVVVPAGSFMMGEWLSGRKREQAVTDVVRSYPPDFDFGSLSEDEANALIESENDESPVHEVTIAKPFAVGVYEVTFDEWVACVYTTGGCGGYAPDDQGWGRGSRPVINVSWEDAERYLDWLSGETGETYRLLSESEWEYATRAGTTGPYHMGRISLSKANYGEKVGKTMPVGKYPPNAFGLYDVHGNVWEWVEDCWNDGYEGAPTDGSVWAAGDCEKAVMRGGSWDDPPHNLRSANRGWYVNGFRGNFLGFRVARTLAP